MSSRNRATTPTRAQRPSARESAARRSIYSAVALVAMVLVRQALLVIDLLRLGGKEASVADRLVLAVDGTVAHDRAEPAAASSSAP